MSLETRLAALITAIGADIKALQAGGGGGAETIIDQLRSKVKMYDDFTNAPSPFIINPVGTGSAVTYPTALDETSIGNALLNLGTSGTGYCSIKTAMDCVLLGRGAARFITRVRFPVLSTSGERFAAFAGFNDAESYGADVVSFAYEESASPNWRCKCFSNDAFGSNIVDSGVAVAANTWYTLSIEINAAGTSAVFKINGTTVATMTGLPIAAGRYTGVMLAIGKVFGGSASRTMYADYLGWEMEHTTLR